MLGNTINVLGIRKKVMLAHSKSNRTGQTILMRAIDQAEEDELDKLRHKTNIYFYGDVDLEAKSDTDTIKNYNFVHNDYRGMIYSTFDYEKGSFDLVDAEVKWGASISPLEWFKFNHCLLGKPAKVVVYNGTHEARHG